MKKHPLLFVRLVIIITAILAIGVFLISSNGITNWLLLLVSASVSAAIASLIFGKRMMVYAQAGQLLQVLATSLMIVVSSHILFGFISALIPQLRGNPDEGFLTMLLGFTFIEIFYGGLITIPFGLIAGYGLYLLMRREKI